MAFWEVIGLATGLYRAFSGSGKSKPAPAGPTYEETLARQNEDELQQVGKAYEENMRRNSPLIYSKRSVGRKASGVEGWNPDTLRVIARAQWIQEPTTAKFDPMESEAERKVKELDYGKKASETQGYFDYSKWRPKVEFDPSVEPVEGGVVPSDADQSSLQRGR